MYGRKGEVYTGFWWGILRERAYLEDLGVDGRIILRRHIGITLIYTYIYIYIPHSYHTDVYTDSHIAITLVYVCIYIERERKRERDST